jgi:hypothetical protein
MESCDKTEQDKEGLLKALDDRIDIITTTTHHTLRKSKTLFSISAPNGSAFAQLHVRVYKQGLISLK